MGYYSSGCLLFIIAHNGVKLGWFSWIVNESNLPWLELDIEFPFEEMHKEKKM